MRGTRFAIPSAVKSQQKPTSNTPPETRLKRDRVEFIFLPLRRAPRLRGSPRGRRPTYTVGRQPLVLAALLGLCSIGFGNGRRLFDRIRRELIRKVRTERRERGEDEWPSPRFSLAAALAAPKRKPRHLTDGRGFGARALNGAQALCGEL